MLWSHKTRWLAGCPAFLCLAVTTAHSGGLIALYLAEHCNLDLKHTVLDPSYSIVDIHMITIDLLGNLVEGPATGVDLIPMISSHNSGKKQSLVRTLRSEAVSMTASESSFRLTAFRGRIRLTASGVSVSLTASGSSVSLTASVGIISLTASGGIVSLTASGGSFRLTT